MKNLFLLLAFSSSSLLFAQKLSKSELKLKQDLKKSFYFTQFPKMDVNFYAIKYNCLQKNYKINPIKEKEFLNKKDFLKKFPDWNKEDDNRYIEFSSAISESLKAYNFDSITKENYVFPKCISTKDVPYFN